MSRVRMVYLHGFASSPRSSKARFFAERAQAAGIPFACPDLNEPRFESLTTTRMVEQVDGLLDELGPGPVVLVGSSLGALVALCTADRRAARDASPRIDWLVFLAPALNLAAGLEEHFGPVQVREWERTGSLEVTHYADGCRRQLHFGFLTDARCYDAYASALRTPTLIFHGRRDLTVDTPSVERWAEARPHVRLELLDDDHQLLSSLDTIWQATAGFIGVHP